MNSTLSKKQIKKLAKEYNIPEYKVKEVINSYFAFTAYVLKHEVDRKTCKYPTIGIPFFGKFYVPDFVRERMIKKQNEDI